MSVTQNSDDEAKMLAGIPASSSLRPRRGDPVILEFQTARRLVGLEDASSLDDDVPVSIGDLAVRIVGRFKLPRVKVLGPPREGSDPSA